MERMVDEELEKKIKRSDVRCEIEREKLNGMDRQCEASVKYKKEVCGARKTACA